MIRILHIVSSLGNGSGVMSVLMNYHRNIDRSRIQFDYLSFKETKETYENEIKVLGGKVYHISSPSITYKYQKEIRKFFENHKEEYQIIHCHPIFASVIFGKTAKKYGVKHVIQHSHTSSYGHNKLSAFRNYFIVILGKNVVTDYAACSEKAKALFFWEKTEKIFLMRNALQIEKYKFSQEKRDKIRKELNIEGNIVVGHVGRFSQEKNHIFLLDVFDAFKKNTDHSKLLLVGDGSEFESIKMKVKKMQLQEDVLFVGRQTEISAYMSAMDVFIFPSKFEGLGMVLLEAQINGLPCLASDCVPPEVTISDLVKYKSLNESAEEWAEDIKKVGFGERNMAYVEMYDINYAAEEVMQYYENLE